MSYLIWFFNAVKHATKQLIDIDYHDEMNQWHFESDVYTEVYVINNTED